MRKVWTEKELRFLRRYYPDKPTGWLMRRLQRSKASIYRMANILELKKSEKYLTGPDGPRLQPGHTKGKPTQFKKGHIPHNKGKKGWSAGGNSLKTRFKPGHRPQTWVPVGSIRVTKDGILQKKVTDTGCTPRDWKSVHSLLWEKHHGPIPEGHIVVFRNQDRTDIRIDNLELITRAENMRRNSIHNLPEALADICRIRGVLNRHINKRTRENEK